MRELFDAALNADDERMTPEGLKAALADADVLVPTFGDVIDADVIAAAGPRLKLIATSARASTTSTFPPPTRAGSR